MPKKFLFCVTIIISIAASGCSDSTPPRHPVRGQVLQGDQPLAEAMVVFHPKVEFQRGLPKPQAITNAEGKFELTMLASGDGAPLGDYAITVELRQERMSGEELTRNGPNLLPPQYAKPATTPLSYSVQRGKNEVPVKLEK